MLRMTSKPVKNAVDKLRPPAIVRLSRAFLDAVVCCKRGRLLHILTELEKMTSRCRITILDVDKCGMSGQDAERLAGVLAQCPALSELYLKSRENDKKGPHLSTKSCTDFNVFDHWKMNNCQDERFFTVSPPAPSTCVRYPPKCIIL